MTKEEALAVVAEVERIAVGMPGPRDTAALGRRLDDLRWATRSAYVREKLTSVRSALDFSTAPRKWQRVGESTARHRLFAACAGLDRAIAQQWSDPTAEQR